MGGLEKLDRYEDQTKCFEAQVTHVKFRKKACESRALGQFWSGHIKVECMKPLDKILPTVENHQACSTCRKFCQRKEAFGRYFQKDRMSPGTALVSSDLESQMESRGLRILDLAHR